MEKPAPNEIEELEHKKMLEEKRQMWVDTVERTGCKEEVEKLRICSEKGDWRACKEEMQMLKKCMDNVKKG